MASVTVQNAPATATVSQTDYTVTVSTGAAVQAIGALSDVTFTSLTDGQILVYDSASGLWVNSTASGTGDMLAATYDPATIAEQLVGLTATQTLTNKTLTSPTINSPTITGLAASTTASGIVELATTAEVDTGTDTARAVTPDALANSALQSTADTAMQPATYDAAGVSEQLVGLTASQTLTNKTINDTSNDVHADTVFVRVFNNTGSTLSKGVAVYASGYNVGQDLVEVSLADASAESTSNVLGLVDADISTGQAGTVDVIGRIKDWDTTAWSVGDELYLSTTAGALTATKPTGSDQVKLVGKVLRSHITAGIVQVSVDRTDKTGFAETLLDDGDAATARTTLGVDAAGTDNSTPVTLAGTPDYLTLSGQQITRNQIDLTTDVTGVLPEANLPDASATAQGVVEIATAAEVNTGTDDTRAISPLALAGSALQSKVDGIETGADVTDTANVTAAGALMDSEVDADLKTLSLPANTTISAFGATLVDDADAATARTTLDVDQAGTDNAPSASTTTAGKVELATTAETTTGTDTARAVTPDGLAGSIFGERAVQITVFDYTTDVATGDGKAYFHIDSRLAGMNLVDVHAEVITAGTTGTTDIQIHNVTQAADMLSTKLTIDTGETGSDTAAAAAVIDTANDDVAQHDLIRIDVDAVSTTAPKGLIVTLGFRLP